MFPVNLYFGGTYLFHAELMLLQRLTEAHLPQEEALLAYQCGGLTQAGTHGNALRQVGVEPHRDAVSGGRRADVAEGNRQETGGAEKDAEPPENVQVT